MKFRITPLNIVMAMAIVGFILMIIDHTPREAAAFGLLTKLLLGALVLICFVADLIFRFALKQLKRVWIIELAFIVIACLFFLILKK